MLVRRCAAIIVRVQLAVRAPFTLAPTFQPTPRVVPLLTVDSVGIWRVDRELQSLAIWISYIKRTAVTVLNREVRVVRRNEITMQPLLYRLIDLDRDTVEKFGRGRFEFFMVVFVRQAAQRSAIRSARHYC